MNISFLSHSKKDTFLYGEQEDDDDGEGVEFVDMEGGRPLPKATTYFYRASEAIGNRLMFLVIIGLIVIFCICVARDGAIDNMEWLSDGIFEVQVIAGFQTAQLKQDSTTVHSLANQVHGGLPIVLFLAVTENQAKYTDAVDSVLMRLLPVFQGMHFNTSAIVWIHDASEPSFLSKPVSCADGAWSIATMGSKNRETSAETIISYLTGKMHVGVMYMEDIEVISNTSEDDLRQLLFPVLLGHPDDAEDISFILDEEAQGGGHQKPPCHPYMDTSVVFAWPHPETVRFFDDASAWVTTVTNNGGGGGSTLSWFVINSLLNDGRIVQHMQGLKDTAAFLGMPACNTYSSSPSEQILRYRAFEWLAGGGNTTIPQKCLLRGPVCCLRFQ